MAEEIGVSFEDITDRYEEIEKQMLASFYAFVRRHSRYYWMHWNMRDINYGFPALEHRARVLGVEPEHIPDDYKYDLAKALVDMYTAGYAKHPRLKNILEMNRISMRDFLLGEEEAQAFEKRSFVRLHMSTLRKVDVIAALAERTEAGDLETRASWWERNGSSIVGAVETITDSWLVRILGLIAISVGIVAGVMGIWTALF